MMSQGKVISKQVKLPQYGTNPLTEQEQSDADLDQKILQRAYQLNAHPKDIAQVREALGISPNQDQHLQAKLSAAYGKVVNEDDSGEPTALENAGIGISSTVKGLIPGAGSWLDPIGAAGTAALHQAQDLGNLSLDGLKNEYHQNLADRDVQTQSEASQLGTGVIAPTVGALGALAGGGYQLLKGGLESATPLYQQLPSLTSLVKGAGFGEGALLTDAAGRARGDAGEQLSQVGEVASDPHAQGTALILGALAGGLTGNRTPSKQSSNPQSQQFNGKELSPSFSPTKSFNEDIPMVKEQAPAPEPTNLHPAAQALKDYGPDVVKGAVSAHTGYTPGLINSVKSIFQRGTKNINPNDAPPPLTLSELMMVEKSRPMDRSLRLSQGMDWKNENPSGYNFTPDLEFQKPTQSIPSEPKPLDFSQLTNEARAKRIDETALNFYKQLDSSKPKPVFEEPEVSRADVYKEYDPIAEKAASKGDVFAPQKDLVYDQLPLDYRQQELKTPAPGKNRKTASLDEMKQETGSPKRSMPWTQIGEAMKVAEKPVRIDLHKGLSKQGNTILEEKFGGDVGQMIEWVKSSGIAKDTKQLASLFGPGFTEAMAQELGLPKAVRPSKAKPKAEEPKSEVKTNPGRKKKPYSPYLDSED